MVYPTVAVDVVTEERFRPIAERGAAHTAAWVKAYGGPAIDWIFTSNMRNIPASEVLIDETSESPAGAARLPMTLLAAMAVLLLGVGLRTVRINEPPVEFHSTRQFHSALIARQYTAVMGGHSSGFDRRVIDASTESVIEPPIMEATTAVAWRLLDSEPTWFPRLLAIAAWAVGGWFLFRLLARLASPIAGVAGVATWSLLPYAVTATRTFQPEALLVSAIVGAIFALVVHDDHPSRRHLVVAGLASGLAVFVKVPAVFLIVPVFVVLSVRRGGLRSLWSRSSMAYAALMVAPSLAYHVYGFFIAGFLRGQQGGRIAPELLRTSLFWEQWGSMVETRFGVAVPVAAVLGVLLARGRARWVGASVFAGYVAFGLVFTYHYSTHDYYHLSLIIGLAIGIGLLADRLVALVTSARVRLVAPATAVVTVALVVMAIWLSPGSPIPQAVPDSVVHAEVVVPAEVRELVGGSTDAVLLAPSYGRSLSFYGEVAGRAWPRWDAPTDDAGVRRKFEKITAGTSPSYFIVTDIRQWDRQLALRSFLASGFRLVASRPDLVIYDLRSGAP